jgi:hypothetical protein
MYNDIVRLGIVWVTHETFWAESMSIGKGFVGALDAFNEDLRQKTIRKQNGIESLIVMYLSTLLPDLRILSSLNSGPWSQNTHYLQWDGTSNYLWQTRASHLKLQ